MKRLAPIWSTVLPAALAPLALLAPLAPNTAAAAATAPDAQAQAAPAAAPRVVILGFDGADAGLTRQWMDEGKLPNLARLRAAGTFAALRTTIPSQTPVSWSTFATGLNPGRHAIFDYLKRDPATYRPSFAAFDESKAPFLWGERTPYLLGLAGAAALALLLFGALKLLRRRTRLALAIALLAGIGAGSGIGVAADRLLPKERPIAVNRQRGDTFWKILGQSGRRVRVMRIPITFPPAPFEHGELLSGLGTPDLSKRIGKPFYFTSELFFTPKGGNQFSVDVTELPDNKGVIPTEIKGPPNDLFPGRSGYVTIPMTLTVAADRSHLDIQVGRVADPRLALKPGEWSDWVRFVFPYNRLLRVHGIGKFRLLALDPEVKLYLSPIQFDPERLPPIVDITTPARFVHDLTSRFGLFKTMGWAIDTWSLTEGTIDEKVFFEDVDATVAKDRGMLEGLLADPDWDVLVQYFEFTDKVQHVMWRYFDPQSPLYTPEGGRQWGGSIEKTYQQMDDIVGMVMRKLPPGAALMVVSDHGFAPWRRSVNFNTWLVKNGYMTLKGQETHQANLEDLFGHSQFFTDVDWSKTRAYAMGFGDIYLNLKGREGQGIVQPGAEYHALAAELQARLKAMVDEDNGEHPIANVFTRDEAYGVYDPELVPDLFATNIRGYRAGWQDTLGTVAKKVFEPNLGVWSGDHCSVDPSLVKGILFSNRKLDASDPYMADIMPTLFDIYHVQAPVKLDGTSLWPKSH
ncbi:MAG TPA: alkaline phosphatase family protein [Thermoanaerobaculia bacterium]|nr:alkaline phosphatase family protein [Thermoanaerobaculia bacterium]